MLRVAPSGLARFTDNATTWGKTSASKRRPNITTWNSAGMRLAIRGFARKETPSFQTVLPLYEYPAKH
jgi:hypothetical protein